MKISGYTIKSRIGSGGQAMVYLAVQESLQRPVALKVLNPLHSDSPEFTARFLNEGRILANLGHSNVITIHDIGVEGGFHYISMELVKGADLKQRMREKIDPDTAVRYLRTIADCLATAHEKKIVHRDIKPANVLFRADGTLLLTDFGIAKQLDDESDLTATGTTVGSPHYLSPEQARGQAVDGRADIYSLGIMAYEMLAGEKPFVGESNIDTIFKHINEPIPRLPERLSGYQELIDRMTAKLPADRFENARDLVEFIDRIAASPIVPVASAPAHLRPVGGPGPDPGTSKTRGSPDKRDGVRPFSDADHEAPTAVNVDTVETEVDLKTAKTQINLDTVETEVDLKAAKTQINLDTVETEVDLKAAKTQVNLGTVASGVERKVADAPSAGRQFMLPIVAICVIAGSVVAWLYYGRDSAQPDAANVQAETPVSRPTVTPQETATATSAVEADPPAPAPATPVVSSDTENRVASLLASAERAIEEFRLTSPEGDNALGYYKEVLTLDPANPVAADGHRRIAERYDVLARSAIKRGNYDKARDFVDRGLSLDPQSSELVALREQIELTIATGPPTQDNASSSGSGTSSAGDDTGSEIKGESPRELFERVKGWFK